MLYHYNIMTRHSRNLDTLRPHELAEINPADAAKLSLSETDQIRVSSRRGSVVSRVKITDKVPPGIMFMTFHYRETPVNELTNAAFDPISKTAEYKVSAVRIEKLAG
jgi:formate dehydrogenase major subunit